MKKSPILVAVASAALLSACGGSSGGSSPSHLTFNGNGNAGAGAVFNGPHAGQTVRAALLDGTTVLDLQKATVAAAGTDPAFSITFAPTIDTSKPYTVNYWIDSDFQTGAAGANKCGAPSDDHQWTVPIPAGQTSFTDVHRPTATANVCSTFVFPLTFVADSSYLAPHHDQPFKAALVHGSDTAAEEIVPGTVAALGSANAISVSFSEQLIIGDSYSVKLWIDSNFSGGTVGVCDPPANDHQWSFPVQNTLASHPGTMNAPTHSGATTTDVCSFFP